jgi:putative ABC transport system permease protein
MTFNLDKALRDWKKTLFKSETLEDGHIEELTEHVIEEFERYRESGIPESDAFAAATASLGKTSEIDSEYRKARVRDLNVGPLSFSRLWVPGLIWSYTKLTLRKLRKQKGYSLINIAGLAMGMACCILILTWVSDEFSYDRFHENSSRVFRIITEDHAGDEVIVISGSPAPIGSALLEEYPGILRTVLVQSGWTGWFLHYGEKIFMQERLAAVGPEFFSIFKFSFLKGDPKTALIDPHSVVLTESLARKCFGDAEPMGKIIQMDDFDLKVTGIVEDIPRNSHLQFDYAFPAENMRQWRESQLDSWSYTQFVTYLELEENANVQAINQKMKELVKKHLPRSKGKIYLQPLTDIHLHSAHINSWSTQYPSPGNITYVYIFSFIAVCVLLIACINFMNLATARHGIRATEVGMRKVVGANRADLIKQFIGESCTLALLSLLIALILVELFLPAFNRLARKEMIIDYSGNVSLWLALLGIALFTGLLSGSYPALFLSSFQPTHVLKTGAWLGGRSAGVLRKVLVVVQFAFTICLIICTAVIYNQLHYIQTKDLGYDADNIMSFAGYGAYEESYEAARSELLQNPDVLSVCRGFPPTQGLRETTNVSWDGKDPSQEIRFYSDMGDYDYLKTFGLEMVRGRFYSREFPTDPDNYVVNETAARLMGFKDPIGRKFALRGDEGVIIGVVKDYHGGSLHAPIVPKVLKLDNGFFVCIKFRAGSTAGIIRFAEEKWKKFVPGHPFRYNFIDESIESHYINERRIGQIVRNFTGLTVLIACLGLFGLASFMAERRTKEIGIRKILGARIPGIISMLSKEFTKWVLAANLIAWPAAYLITREWLQGFAYSARLGIELFFLSSVLALLIALLTISFQTIRAATSNPVDSLRYE